MCMAPSPPPPPPAPIVYKAPKAPEPPPPPPAPPPPPVSAGQKMATIQSKAAVKQPAGAAKGAAAFKTAKPKLSTITGQTTGLNVPSAQ